LRREDLAEMRLCVLWFVAAAVLAALGPACEPTASRSRGGADSMTGAAPPTEKAEQRPADVRASERRGDRHARAEARRAPGVERVSGTVSRAGARTVAIRRTNAPPLTLRVAPGTTITMDGRPARLETLREGAEVRASYRPGGGRPTAIAIEAQTPPPRDPRPEPDASGASWGTSPEPPPPTGGE
jgi:hypothetical protein